MTVYYNWSETEQINTTTFFSGEYLSVAGYGFMCFKWIADVLVENVVRVVLWHYRYEHLMLVALFSTVNSFIDA